MPIHTHVFGPILAHKLGHTDLLFGVQSRFISRSVHKDYKSLCAAVTMCATLVNIQTDTHTERQHLTRLYDKLRQLT